MGIKNAEALRAGKQNQSSYLANELRGLTGEKLLNPSDFTTWASEAEKLKGRDPFELAAIMYWAVKESDYWSGWGLTMEKFVKKVDDISRDYRAAQRQKQILENQTSGVKYSPTCLALFARYPGKTRPYIEDEDTKARADVKVVEFSKTCRECKGKHEVKSKLPRIKGKPILCHTCEAYRVKIWSGIKTQVHKELYA
jgi:hypothetical protein